MKYQSTRGGVSALSFCDAVMTGLAPDGGLLLPESIPQVASQLDDWAGLSYPELAEEILALYIDDIPRHDLHVMVQDSYRMFRHPEVTPVVTVGPWHLLELFHGPTLAFKDVALQFLGHLFEWILARRGDELNIVAATSGDTGSAAIYGVRGRPGIRIFVMHPRGRVSATQERQMTSVLDENVFNLAVDGTFDDCQSILKDLYADLPFKASCRLGSVNSINWARVLAQIVYYFYASFRVQERGGGHPVSFSVPTGNFGDIFAGYLAARMGLPVHQLLLATNENDILARFFNSGVYRRGEVQGTLSPSMDIQVASNFERYLFYRTGEDAACVRALMTKFQETGCLDVSAISQPDALFAAGSGNSQETLETIRYVYRQYGYLLDPHTAVGVHVAEKLAKPNVPVICFATAHPAKFQHAIEQATGEDLAHHPVLDMLADQPTRRFDLPGDMRIIKSFIRDHVPCGADTHGPGYGEL